VQGPATCRPLTQRPADRERAGQRLTVNPCLAAAGGRWVCAPLPMRL